MGVEDSPAYHRKALGKLLRRLRREAGYAFREAFVLLEFSETTLHRMELGLTKVDVHQAKSMLDLYGVPANEWEPILDLVRKGNRRGWWSRFGLTNKSYAALETAATAVYAFCFGYLHGLLQTEAYMEAVFRASQVSRTEKQLRDQIEIRRIRQLRLGSKDDPLQLVAIIDEGALRRPVGGREVMRAQLQHLLDVIGVTIQVLPVETGAHLGVYGSFSILEFPDESMLGYYGHVNGPTFISRAADVERCRLKLETLRSLALSPDDSRELIKRVLEELR